MSDEYLRSITSYILRNYEKPNFLLKGVDVKDNVEFSFQLPDQEQVERVTFDFSKKTWQELYDARFRLKFQPFSSCDSSSDWPKLSMNDDFKIIIKTKTRGIFDHKEPSWITDASGYQYHINRPQLWEQITTYTLDFEDIPFLKILTYLKDPPPEPVGFGGFKWNVFRYREGLAGLPPLMF